MLQPSPARAVWPRWMTTTLRVAAVYNVVWGALAILLPKTTLGLLLPEEQIIASTIVFWQCIGMIVGVYGVGYWIAGDHPYRHWPIVVVGLLGKILGPIGFVDAALIRGVVPPSFGYTILTNDLIWWVPFSLILVGAYRDYEARRRASLLTHEDLEVREAFGAVGRADLIELSKEKPLLVVMLRHFGCTYCREALGDLAKQRARIEAAGVVPVLVHMVDDARAASSFEKYDLPAHERVSDPEKHVYKGFGLARGTLGELLGPRVWLRGLDAGLLQRHGVGALAGDGLQMPGAFLVRDGRVVRAFRHRDAADRADYGELCEIDTVASPPAAYA